MNTRGEGYFVDPAQIRATEEFRQLLLFGSRPFIAREKSGMNAQKLT
jgi:hypothetical protein